MNKYYLLLCSKKGNISDSEVLPFYMRVQVNNKGTMLHGIGNCAGIFIRLMLLPKVSLPLSIASHYHTHNDNSIFRIFPSLIHYF